MGSYTFRWPYDANEVFVTGNFDDWGKTIKLERKGDVFEKEVHLPLTTEKVYYKFVVDDTWTTDNRVPEEDDGHNNINNVLYPSEIQKESLEATQNGSAGMATISGVTPESTTAALAAGVPKESSKTTNGVQPTISSAAPGSTTAELGKEVPLEQRTSVPGQFPGEYSVSPIPASGGIGNPITLNPGEKVPDPSTFNSNTIQSTVQSGAPSGSAGEYSVNPIPASSGIGNPIHLKPGEKVPDPSTFNSNTVQSTVRTDQAGYEQGAGALQAQESEAFKVPPQSKNLIPESSLPMGGGGQAPADPGVTIQSAAPTSTTAGLAAAVPLEPQKQKDSSGLASDVPEVVKESFTEAHKDPEAAAIERVVEEKKEVEEELQKKVHKDTSTGTPAPVTTAATTATAPQATAAEPGSAQLSPRTQSPSGAAGAGATKASETTNNGTAATQVPAQTTSKTGKEEKKKKRSSIFARLKEKFK